MNRHCSFHIIQLLLLFCFAVYSEVLAEQKFHECPSYTRSDLIEKAKLAEYVYNEIPRQNIESMGFFVIEPIKELNKLTYSVLYRGGIIYIIFRGTNDVDDAVADINIIASGNKEITIPHLESALDKTRQYIQQRPGLRIVLVGHSLGGAAVQYVLYKLKSPMIQGYIYNPIGLPGNLGVINDNRLTEVVNSYEVAQIVKVNSRVQGRRIVIDLDWKDVLPDLDWTDVPYLLLGPPGSLVTKKLFEAATSPAVKHKIGETIKTMEEQHKKK